jgi:hypothetical protein
MKNAMIANMITPVIMYLSNLLILFCVEVVVVFFDPAIIEHTIVPVTMSGVKHMFEQ